MLGGNYLALRVHVPNNWVLRVLVIAIVVQVLGKYMTIRYLDPKGRASVGLFGNLQGKRVPQWSV